MGLFNDIPTRTNTQVNVSWWNSLRAAGAFLENMLGGGIAVETQFTIANNQSSAASITGLVFDKTVYITAEVQYTVMRKTDTAASGVRETGRLLCTYESQENAWNIEPLVDTFMTNGPSGITFSITSAGQIQYTSTNITGANYVGKMRHKVVSTFSVET
jgi:hypothetical protein